MMQNHNREEGIQIPALSLQELSTPIEQVEGDKKVIDPGLVSLALAEIRKQNLKPVALHAKLKQLSQESGCPAGVLEKEYESLRREPPAGQSTEEIDPGRIFNEKEKQLAVALASEKNLFKVFPSLVRDVGYITDEFHAAGMLLSIALTRLPFVSFICFYGDSSDGKTFAAETVNAFIDFNQQLGKVVPAIDVSPNWIKYAGGVDGRAMQNKRLFLDELNPAKAGEDDYRQSLMRQMDSDQQDRIQFRIADRLQDGSIGERVLAFWKPVHFLYTSITPPQKWDLQNRNRTFYLEFSHDNYSATEVMNHIADSEELTDPVESDTPGPALTLHAFNYFLEKYAGRMDKNDPNVFADVKVPFLKELIPNSGNNCGSDIRRFKLMNNAIKASALLHAGHRKQVVQYGRKMLIAEREDFENIREVVERMVSRVSQPAGNAYLKTFKKIVWYLYNNQPKNKKDLQKNCGISKKAMEEHPADLVSVDLLNLIRLPNERSNFYELGSAFYAHIDAVGMDESTVLRRADLAIAKIELTNSLGPSTSLNEQVGKAKDKPSLDSGNVPRSLATQKKKEKTFNVQKVLDS